MKLKLKYIKKRIYRLEVSPHDIRKKFGDLRFRKTWEMAYTHYVGKNNIVAFVPPSPPVHNPTVAPQRLLPPAKELPALPPAKIPQKPSDRLTEEEGKLLFGEPEYKSDAFGQLLLFSEIDIEPPDPDDYPNDYEHQYQLWAKRFPEVAAASKHWNEIQDRLNEWHDQVMREKYNGNGHSVPILSPFLRRNIATEDQFINWLLIGLFTPRDFGGDTTRYSHPIDYG